MTLSIRAIRVALSLTLLFIASSASAVTKQWLNTSNDGLWTTASNWSPAGVPGSGDDVQIGTSQTAFNCTLNVSTTVNSITITDPYITNPQLVITGGAQLTINAASSTASGTTIDMNGQILGAGNLTLGGNLIFRGGTVGGTGTLIVTSSGGINLSGTNSSMQLNRVVTSDGTILHASATSSVYLGANLTNTGLLNITVDADIYVSGSPVITNGSTGTIRKSSGAATSNIHATVDNNNGALIESLSGTLALKNGTSTSGSVFATTNSPSQSTLKFSSGTTYTLGSGTTFNGNGIVFVQGTLNAGTSADVTIVNITLDANGAIGGPGILRVSSSMLWNGGTLTGGGSTSISAGATLTLAGTNNYLYLDNRILEIAGTANYTASSYGLYMQNGGVLNVVSGGTFNIQTDLDIHPGGGTYAITNAGTFQKTGGSGDTTINIPITSSGAFNVTQGTLGLYNAVTFNGGTISIGSISFLDIRSSLTTFASATTFGGTGGFRMDGGDVKVNSGVTQTIARLTLQSNSSSLSGPGNIILTGTSTFTIGSFGNSAYPGGTLEVASGATLNLSTAAGYKYIDSGIAFTNNGTVNVQDPTYGIYLTNGSTFVNNGLVDVSTDSNIYKSGVTANDITNNGTWRKSAGSGTYSIFVAFYNAGTIDVQSGTLLLAGGGNGNGIFQTAASTTLRFNNSYTLGAAADFSGSAGSVEVTTSGNLTIPSGNVTIPNFILSGGTVGGAGSLTLTGSPAWSSGAMGDPVAQGGFTIVDSAATFTLTGTAYLYVQYGRTLQNNGTIVYSAPTYYLYLQNNGTIDNDGTFTYATDAGIFGTGAGSITNSGTITKTAGSGTAAIDVVLHNSGTITSQSGTLELGGAAATNTHTGGTFIATGSARFEFGGGVHTLDAASSLTGTGIIGANGGANVTVAGPYNPAGFRINTATLTLNSSGSVASLEMLNSAILDGTGTLTITSSATWSGGTMQGSGTTIIDSGATLNITGVTNYAYLSVRTLTNNGTIVYGPTNYLNLSNAATINNAGTFQFTSDAQINGSHVSDTINNSGTMTKTSGSAVTHVAPVVNNSGSITVSAGTLQFNRGGTHTGSFTATSPGVVAFGGGTHNLSGAGTLTGTGKILFTGSATTNVGVSYNPNAIRVDAGTANFNANGSTTNLELVNGILGGTGTFTVTGSALWSGGQMKDGGTTVINSGVTLTMNGSSSYSYLLDGRILTNNGAIVYSTPVYYLSLSGNAVINNNGSFTITSDTTIYSGTVGDTFHNAGTFVKNAGSATTVFSPAFNNSGSVAVSAGGVSFNRGGTHSGPFTATSPGIIGFGGGTHTVGAASSLTGTGTFSVSNGIVDVAGSYNPGAISITNGGLNLNSSGSVASYTQTAGTLGGSGTLTITGAATWSGGTMGGTGTTLINSGVTMNLTAATGYPTLDDRTLTNNGSIVNTASPYYVVIQNSGTLNNNGTFTHNDSYIYGSAADVINNSGTFSKSSGTATANVSATLHNSGTVTVSSGTLVLAGNGTSTGSFNANSPGKLDLSTGTRTFNGPGSLTVTGELIVSNGTTDVNGTWSMASLKLTGGVLNLNTNGSVNALALQSSGTLGGSGTVAVTTSANWTGGTMAGSGTTVFSSGLTTTLAGSSNYMILDGRTVTNNGTFQYSAAPYHLYLHNGATINNAGTFLIGNDLLIYSATMTDTFNNSGTLSKTAGSGDTNFYPTLVNSGSVNVSAGEITFFRGGTHSGAFTATTPGVIDFGGAQTIAAASSLGGSGKYRFSSGTVDVHGTYASPMEIAGGTANLHVSGSIPSLVMNSGTLGGNSTLTIANSLTWSGGTMQGSGTTVIAAAATATVPNNAGYAYLDTRTLENDGTLTYAPGTGFYFNTVNAQIVNDGTIQITGDSTWNGGGSAAMTNNGTIEKTAGSGVHFFYLPTTNNGTFRVSAGTLQLINGYTQTAGFTEVQNAILKTGSALAINGGTLRGSGTIDGSVQNAAIVAPGTSAGALAITGNYTQTAAGALNIELGGTTAGSQYDQLNVTGAVSLDGTLNISTINSFVPTTGDVFQVLGFGSRSGDFATKNGLSQGSGVNLVPTYGANVLQLTANTVASDVFVSQTISPSSSVVTGQSFTYNVTVTNGGASNASSVSLTGTLPSNVTLVSVTPSQGTCSGNPSIACSLGALANGANATIAITVTANAPGAAAFTASVSAAEFDPDTADNNATATATVSPKADLSVTITDSPDPVAGNGTITYAVTVANAGPDAASSVTFTISVDSGATISGATASGWSCNSGTTTRTCTIASLASGANASLSFTATPPNATATVTANASVTASTFDPATANNNASTTTTTSVCTTPVISAPQSVDANSSGHQATTSAVTGATYAWTITNGTITSGQASNVVTFTAGATGSVTLSVTVTLGACNDSATVTIPIVQPSADLSVTITDSPDPVAANGTISYAVNIANSGPSAASALTFTITVNSGAAISSSNGSGWSCDSGSPSRTCTLPSLASGATTTLTFTATAPSAGATVNATAAVSATTSDPGSANNSASTSTTVQPPPTFADLSVTISDSPDPVAGNGTINYTVNVANAGPNAAANVSVSVSVDNAAILTSMSGSGWNCGSGASLRTCTIASLGSGASSTLTATATAPNVAATITASAGVSSSTSDSVNGNNSATTTTNTSVCSTPTISAPQSVAANSTGNQASTTFLNGASYAWTIVNGSITAGQGSNVVTFTAGASGSVTLTVTVTNGACSDTNSATIPIQQPPASADLGVTITDSPDPVAGNGTITYSVGVTNNGPDASSNVSVSITVNSGATLTGITAAGWTCGSGATTRTCTIASLGSGATSTLTITATAPNQAATISASAAVNSSTADPVGGNNVATTTTVTNVCGTPVITAPQSVAANSTAQATTSSLDGATYAWTITNGTITAGQGSHVVTFTAGASGQVTLSVTVTLGACSGSATATVPIQQPPASADLAVTISDSPDPVSGNGTITYAIGVTNNGPDTANSLTFSVNIGGGAKIVSLSGTGWTCGSGTTARTCTRASLASAASASLTMTAQAPNAAATVNATASVSSTVNDAMPGNNSASTTTTTNVCATPVITAPSSVEANSTNNGASIQPAGQATITWSITNGTITAGQGTTAITFTANGSGNVVLGVQVVAGPCNQSASVTIPINQQQPPSQQAEVSIVKSAPATVAAGQSFAYTITVANNGPANAFDVLVLDTLPTEVLYVSTSASGWNCAQNGGTISCAVTQLFAGSSRSFTINVKAPDAATTFTNTASVSTSTADSDSSNNAASATTSVQASAPVCPSAAPLLTAPADGAAGVSSPVTFTWSAVANATSYDLYVGSGNASPSLAGSTPGTAITIPMPAGSATWYVVARGAAACETRASATRTLTVAAATNCNANPAAQLIAPAAGATVSSPVTFQWAAANGAIGYTLWLSRGSEPFQDFGATTATTFTATVPAASVRWYVEAHFAGCPSTTSAQTSFTVPQPPACQNEAPRLTAPANNVTLTSGSVAFSWSAVANANGYRLWTQRDSQPAQVVGETTDTTLAETIAAGTLTWWVEALFEGCPSRLSDKRTLTIARAQQCNNSAPVLIAPASGVTTSAATVAFSWQPAPRAVKYELWLALDNGTPSLLATTTSTSVTREVPEGTLTWFVRALFDGCDPIDSASATFHYAAPAACTTAARPVLLAPYEGEQLPSPVDFRWQHVGASSYELWIAKGNAQPAKVKTLTTNEAPGVVLPNGAHRWFVRAIFGNGCPDVDSSESRMVIVPQVAACSPLGEPVVAAPGQISHGARAFVQWSFVPGATAYVLQISTHPDFSNAGTETLNLGEQRSYPFTFDNDGTAPVARYIRVRAIDERCQPASVGAYSPAAAIYVLPRVTNDVATLAGAGTEVTYTLPLGAELAGLRFTATPTQPWLTVTPSSGTVPAGGINLSVVARTQGLPPGTSIGGVTITTTDATSGGIRADATSTTTPVSVSIVSPVTPTPKNTPPPDALLIPAVAHANGINSQFQSDVRVSNTSPQVVKYQLTFTPSGESGITKGQQTTFSVEPGQTVALDDILKTWFGSGNSQVFGALEVRSLTTSSKSTSTALAGLPNLTTFASSRTYNVTAKGTFGQYVPAIPFASFVDAASKSVLQLPQIAQSAQYRTNLGFVEGSGQPASLLVTVYGQSGKITEFPVQLTGGQHLQMNSVLASKGIESLDDGRIEVKVISGGGKVTAYASVLDSQTNDPLLVAPIQVANEGGQKWVVPGVADLKSGLAEWRSDMRLFNAGTEPVEATLTFHAQGKSEPVVKTLTIAPGEIQQLDSTLSSVFGVTNDGGAVHVSTPKAAKLIATARTYNQTANGTFGQFIPAVTPNEAASKGSRPLQILQVEESERYRSNIGLAEVSGKPARVEVAVVRPETKTSAFIEVNLAANEFRQLNRLLESAGLGGTYNARVTVRVVSGDGRVAAYASVVDMETQDPTYIPAQ